MLREFIDAYYHKHDFEITQMMESYIESVASDPNRLPHEVYGIVEREKTPILFINFDDPGVPVPQDCVQFIDGGSAPRVFASITTDDWIRGIMQKWWIMVDDDNILVIGCFPRRGNIPLVVDRFSEFPPRSFRGLRSYYEDVF